MDNVINVDFKAPRAKVEFIEPEAREYKVWTVREAEELLKGLHTGTKVFLLGEQAHGLFHAVIKLKRAMDWIECAVPRLQDARTYLTMVHDALPRDSMTKEDAESTEASLLARRAVIEELIEELGRM